MVLLRQPMPSHTPVGCHSEGAQGGTKRVLTMEVDGTDYHQPDALITDHPAVTAFFCGQGGTMNYRDTFNTVKQAKPFCWEHFNGLIFRQSIILGSTTVLLQPGEVGQRARMFT